jgi:hypothetical protein
MQRNEQFREDETRQSTTYAPTNDAPAFAADCGRVMRFLRQREQELIEQVRSDVVDPRAHDAVSADEAALHLGWLRRDESGRQRPQTERAARVLERLCTEQRVVCFTKPRMRRGEEGEIRLYCTAEHLEALTRLLDDEAEPSLPIQ